MNFPPADSLDLALPVWAGMSFSAIGIAYQIAQGRKVTPLRVFFLLAICGTALFAVKTLTSSTIDASSRVLLLGIASGLSQYINIKLVGRAMSLGPFSLVWCMLSLTFAPVVLYAAAVQGIPQPTTQWIAVGLAVLCCILASAGHDSSESKRQTTTSPERAKIIYGILLVTILFTNALSQVSLQDLNITAPGKPREVFFLAIYVAIAISSLFDAIAAGEVGTTIRRAWLPGILAGFGSVSGMFSLGLASTRTGPAAFLICSMVTLILPMLAAVLIFKEKLTARWIGTLILGLAAIALANR